MLKCMVTQLVSFGGEFHTCRGGSSFSYHKRRK